MKKNGFGLLEIVIAVAVWFLLAQAGVMMTTGSMRLNRQSSENDQAVALAGEGLDAVRMMKKVGWTTPFLATNCTAGCGVATVSGTWGYAGSENVMGKYTRKVFVSNVNRDVGGNIVSSGGTADPDTYKVESRVTWNRQGNTMGQVSLVSYLTNYVKSIVTSLTGGLLIYGDGTIVPKYRTYNRSTNVFSSEQSGVTGAVGRVWRVETSPTKTEAVAGYVTSGGVLQVMCFDGTAWSNDFSVTVGGTATSRRFDVGYETSSGDAMVVYSANVGTTNELRYRTKSGGSGCGSANWSAETSLDPVRTTGIVFWVEMARDKRSSSNLIGLSWTDANSDLSAMIWNGTGWVNEPSAATETSLEVIAAAGDSDNFEIEYESVSGDLMLVWANSAGANGTNGVRYRVCTGGTATCTWGAVTTPPTFLDDAHNMDLSADPDSDQMIFASIGAAGSDLQTGVWSGSDWSNRPNVDSSCATPVAGSKLVATGWLNAGSTKRAVVIYNDSGTTNVGWLECNPVCTPKADWVPTPAFNTTQRWYELVMDGVSKDQAMLLVSANTTSFYAKRLVMTSTPSFTWSNADGGAALETTLSTITVSPYGFTYFKQ